MQRTEKSEIRKLSLELKKFYSGEKKKNYGWNNTALNVIDCVLSLNRQYFSFCRPRVEKFHTEHPKVKTLLDLQELLSLNSPELFMKEKLNYRHLERAVILDKLVAFLAELLPSSEKAASDYDDRNFFRDWAENTDYTQYKKYKISGFGIAGFQYLRMLFGANTTKPDIHIVRFVSGILGRTVNQEETVILLEEAAKSGGFHLRTVEGEIWNSLAAK